MAEYNNPTTSPTVSTLPYDPNSVVPYVPGPTEGANDGARAILQQWLDQWGLGHLGGWAWGLITSGATSEEIYLQMLDPTTEGGKAYEARFPGMRQLMDEDRAISESQYIAYEQQMRTIEQRWGLTPGLISDAESVAAQLYQSVYEDEMNERAAIAAAAAYQSSPDVQQALSDLYGIGPGGLVSYWFDPDRAQPLLEKQFAASQIAGAARARQVATDQALAERLAEQGVSYAEAQKGFGDVSDLERLQGGSGERISEQGLIASRFGLDTAAAAQQRRVQGGRIGRFAGGGGAAQTQEGVTGLGESLA